MAPGQATPPTRRIRARVRGRVQGVGYRAGAARAAARLGLAGWVANQADGTVALEAQGPAAAVAALLAWCQRGPALAAVAAVDVDERPVADGDVGFAIRR
ncbi:MAG: acylphosphatase [Myxococcales bacterium]|nr:acylphosphatase [Myxococcales bacterium]